MDKAGLIANKPTKKESAIPNTYPNKEELVNSIE